MLRLRLTIDERAAVQVLGRGAGNRQRERVTMARPERWDEVEFRILMHTGALPTEELAPLLPGCSVTAIRAVAVCEGVHDYHVTRTSDTLSWMQRGYLAQHRGALTCPLGGAPV